MGTLTGIAIRYRKRGELHKLADADITTENGVQGDFRGKPGKRQVTVLSREAWELACNEIGIALDWTTRRANLCIDGVILENTTGSRLIIGDIVLEITGETDPCERMDEAWPGLRKALTPNWRGGVTCRVLKSGHIKIGDKVFLKDKDFL